MEKILNLPRAVREQAERAERAHQALLGNTATAAPETEVLEVPPVETQPIEIVTPEAPVVVPLAHVEAAVAEVPIADSWELKYRVLNGKYQAEIPRYAQELREAKEALRNAQTSTTASPAAGQGATPAGQLPQEVVDQYGEDLTNAITTVAAAQMKPLRDELSSKVDRLDVEAGERRRSDFLRDLSTHVPNWAQIDRDPGFTAYLDDFDAQTGKTRREFFNEADGSNNAPRVASFFATYAKGTNKPAPVQAVAATPAPSVEHLIAPDSSRHSEAPEGKKTWTRVEVAKFYSDSRAQGGSKPYGRYTAAEYARIDADISKAPDEGRYAG